MKYKSSGKAGCENPAQAEQTSVKGGGKHLGKKTWAAGAEKLGFTVVSVGKYTGASVGLNTGGSSGGKQGVKGKMGKKASVEAKPAAGRD